MKGARAVAVKEGLAEIDDSNGFKRRLDIYRVGSGFDKVLGDTSF
jgi:hypothetical protein